LKEIRSKYTAGVNSLWTNLPHPRIIGPKDERGNHYAWVKVIDCVAHFLASGGILITTNEMAKATLSLLYEDEIAKWYTVMPVQIQEMVKKKEDITHLLPIILAPAIHRRPSEMIQNVYCKICYNYSE